MITEKVELFKRIHELTEKETEIRAERQRLEKELRDIFHREAMTRPQEAKQ